MDKWGSDASRHSYGNGLVAGPMAFTDVITKFSCLNTPALSPQRNDSVSLNDSVFQDHHTPHSGGNSQAE
jgi:hypothetical protein